MTSSFVHRTSAAAILTVLGLFPGLAGASPGPTVPLQVDTIHRFLVVLMQPGGPNDSIEMTGNLPLSMPFNLMSGVCSASGTATLALVQGGLQLDLANTTLTGTSGSGCNLEAQIEHDLTFGVPFVGDAMTPVVLSVSSDGSRSGGIFRSLLSESLGSEYFSSILGLARTTTQVVVSHVDPASSTVSIVEPYIAGDSVTPSFNTLTAQYENPGQSGVLDMTIRFEAFLPGTTVAFNAPTFTPWGRAGLTAALIGIAGVTFARSRGRIQSEPAR